MTQDTPLLVVSDVTYRYTADVVLDHVSFELFPREIGALIGRNGAGKSTLLRCLAGWTRPSSGTITVGGKNMATAERELRREIVLVPDMPNFYDDLTAWEHLQFIGQAHRVADWKTQAEGHLARFGLQSARDTIPLNFSRGMRYKLALCMALLVRPTLLLLDEPFGPLDPVSADELWDILVEACEGQTCVLLSSHQLPEDVMLDRYFVLEQGQLIADGSPDELQVTFHLAEDYSLDELLRAALKAHIPA